MFVLKLEENYAKTETVWLINLFCAQVRNKINNLSIIKNRFGKESTRRLLDLNLRNKNNEYA
jgi:hypothetical protein